MASTREVGRRMMTAVSRDQLTVPPSLPPSAVSVVSVVSVVKRRPEILPSDAPRRCHHLCPLDQPQVGLMIGRSQRQRMKMQFEVMPS